MGATGVGASAYAHDAAARLLRTSGMPPRRSIAGGAGCGRRRGMFAAARPRDGSGWTRTNSSSHWSRPGIHAHRNADARPIRRQRTTTTTTPTSAARLDARTSVSRGGFGSHRPLVVGFELTDDAARRL